MNRYRFLSPKKQSFQGSSMFFRVIHFNFTVRWTIKNQITEHVKSNADVMCKQQQCTVRPLKLLLKSLLFQTLGIYKNILIQICFY